MSGLTRAGVGKCFCRDAINLKDMIRSKLIQQGRIGNSYSILHNRKQSVPEIQKEHFQTTEIEIRQPQADELGTNDTTAFMTTSFTNHMKIIYVCKNIDGFLKGREFATEERHRRVRNRPALREDGKERTSFEHA